MKFEKIDIKNLTFNALCPEEYPYKPPVVRFTSKMFHPNVHPTGNVLPDLDGFVSLDILQNRWTPAYDVSAILVNAPDLDARDH